MFFGSSESLPGDGLSRTRKEEPQAAASGLELEGWRALAQGSPAAGPLPSQEAFSVAAEVFEEDEVGGTDPDRRLTYSSAGSRPFRWMSPLSAPDSAV